LSRGVGICILWFVKKFPNRKKHKHLLAFPSSESLSIQIERAASLVRAAKRVAAFTGAGVSVESGIPPFRGPNGLWSKYDPKSLDIDFFLQEPRRSWGVIREIFYERFKNARPNAAHLVLAEMERQGLLHAVITQNIDGLHTEAGSRTVWEFHGNSRYLICLDCGKRYRVEETDLEELPPTCRICGGLLKPDFVFFGERIPEPARTQSFVEARRADTLLVIGTSGEVMPAGMIPRTAKESGAAIIEINPAESELTRESTDVLVRAGAAEAMTALAEALDIAPTP
jgi:NAD-dependent deacetylase